MKEKIRAILAEEPLSIVIQVLGELGYTPKLEQGAVVLPASVISSIAAARGITSTQLETALATENFSFIMGGELLSQKVQAAEAKTKMETLAYVQSLYEICALEGMEKMVPALIAKEAKVEDARAEVLAEKAKRSERARIRSTIGGTSADGANPLVADAKKRLGSQET